MNISSRLSQVRRIFLDTAPLIYYVEKHPIYASKAQIIFESLDAGQFSAVSSPVTLAECLVVPYRLGKQDVAQAFIQILAQNDSVTFVSIDETIAEQAANVRARYNLSLADALQISAAMAAGCDTFLTNDVALKRIPYLDVLVLDEI